MRLLRRLIAGVITIGLYALVGAANVAHAQPSGVQLGEFRVNAGLRLETGYDTNVYYNAINERRATSVRLNVGPSLRLTTIDPRGVDLRIALSARWDQYFRRSIEPSRDPSGLRTTFDVSARFNPRGSVSVMPANLLRRSFDPGFSDSADPIRALFNETSVTVGWHPGGAARESRLGFSGSLRPFYRLWRYAPSDSIDKNSGGAGGELRWNFLPRTALFIMGNIARTTYQEPDTVPIGTISDQNAATRLPNAASTPYRIGGGVTGLVSRQLGLLLRAGYGGATYETGDSTRRFIAQAQLTLYLPRDTSIAAGYYRDFGDSAFGNYVNIDRGYINLDTRIQRVSVSLEGFVQRNRFSENDRVLVSTEAGLVPLYTEDVRRDLVFGGAVSAAFALTRFMDVGARYRLRARQSNVEFRSIAGEAPFVNASPDYLKHLVMVFVEFTY